MRNLLNLVVLALVMPIFVMGGREVQKLIGLTPIPVSVVGTGSMYPSLYWDKDEGGPDDSEMVVVDERRTTPHMYRLFKGVTVHGKTYLSRSVSRGDMVAFQSDATEAVLAREGKDTSAGFIKRVIGIAGDTIELRDGYVVRNGEEIAEPYIYKPRSTYGESSVAECKEIKIPEGSYLVLGDNRKVSADSRGELGLVKQEDITFVLPLSEQQYYQTLWRDTTKDADLAGTPTLDKQAFYRELNKMRRARGISELKVAPLLERSASYAASGNTLETAMSRAGYRNTRSSEFSITGRFTAEELLHNLFFFENTAKQILDPVMTDVGITDVNRDTNGCPGEIIVGHLGGYVPAEYELKTVESWRSLRDNLREILPSWERAVEYESIDQGKLSELLALFQKRLTLAEEVIAIMEKREWLTDEQQTRIEQDTADATRADQLANELNKE